MTLRELRGGAPITLLSSMYAFWISVFLCVDSGIITAGQVLLETKNLTAPVTALALRGGTSRPAWLVLLIDGVAHIRSARAEGSAAPGNDERRKG